jgi:hypothetical protein
MTAAAILAEIEPLGTEGYRKVMRNHGAKDPIFGVKIDDLKKIQKRVKKDYQLANDLYATGVYDAQYLAGLIADDLRMSKADLQQWLETANGAPISENTVAWVAAESNHGREMALEWIEAGDEATAAAGWLTLSGLVAIKADSDLDLTELKQLLYRVQSTIHQQPNRARSGMNSFIIAVGSYVKELSDLAIETGAQIGRVTVDVGATSCKVPFAPEYIEKAKQRGSLGKKRKTIKC